MNAYNELLRKSLDPSEYKAFLNHCCDVENYIIEECEWYEYSKSGKRKIGIGAVIMPLPNSSEAKHWVKSIKYAKVDNLVLPSNRSDEDEMAFLEGLQAIEYDNGYGLQELYGTIVFDDGSWLERDEYDGKEWWSHKHVPSEAEVINFVVSHEGLLRKYFRL